jgi:hypothetical protein
MKWEYQVIAKQDLDEFISCLNKLGDEGWEAISGGNCVGETETVDVPGTRSTMERPGHTRWVAVLKRQK